MKRGLVIGKFMPVHNGHIALIDFAKKQCDELIVSMSYTEDDLIDPSIRFEWLQTIYHQSPGIIVEKVIDDFDDESLSLTQRTELWARFIEKKFPPIDLIVSSEEYGEPFANHLGVTSLVFDLSRNQVPVSSSQIRTNPCRYWDFIPPAVRPFFVKKICFYGAESTGKSTMAQRMALYYNTEFVPEVAREMINSNNFTVSDIEKIGIAHAERIAEKVKIANKLLFCDTDAITTQVYSQHYLHKVPEILFELEAQIKYDQYFFFDIDVPWVADGLRDLGNRREAMSNQFKSALEKRGIPFIMVRGTWEERFEIIKVEMEKLIGNQ